MASAGARAYKGGLGWIRRSGGPPEAESLLAFVHPRETSNLASFPYRHWISYIVKPRPNYKQELERQNANILLTLC